MQAQLRTFFDTGIAKTIEPSGGGDGTDSLSGAGVGADVLWRRDSFRVSGKVDWSLATDNRVASDGKDNRVYASLLVGF